MKYRVSVFKWFNGRSQWLSVAESNDFDFAVGQFVFNETKYAGVRLSCGSDRNIKPKKKLIRRKFMRNR